MGNIYRGIRNVWRNRSRTAIVVVILAVATSLALVMLGLDADAKAEVQELTSRVGTVIEVVPGAGPGQESSPSASRSLPSQWVEEIATLPGTASVSVLVLVQYPGIPLCNGVVPGQPLEWVDFRLDQLVAGRGLQPDDIGLPVVLVGQGTAESEGVSVGDRLQMWGRGFDVVGVYRSTLFHLSQGVIMPYDVATETFGLDGLGGLGKIVVRAGTLGEVDALCDAIKNRYGHAAMVRAHKDTKVGELTRSLAGLADTIRVGLIAALLTTAVIVFGSTYLVVRERAREIGILKAVGAGRKDILIQFGSEALVVSLSGVLLGIIIFALAGPAVATAIATRPAETQLGREGVLFIPGKASTGGGEATHSSTPAPQLASEVGHSSRLLKGRVSVTLTWVLAGRALLGGLALGLAGGLAPSLMAARLKPAEVIRRG